MDLSRAEAVMDVIHSQNEYALTLSVSQLKGNLSKEVKRLRKEILHEIAFIESALDDPEHFNLEQYPEKLSEKICDFIKRVKKWIDTAENGKIIKEGIQTVIVGNPKGYQRHSRKNWRREDKGIYGDSRFDSICGRCFHRIG